MCIIQGPRFGFGSCVVVCYVIVCCQHICIHIYTHSALRREDDRAATILLVAAMVMGKSKVSKIIGIVFR